MFNTVLIANRGEIACRAIYTLKKLGITSVVVYSNVDKNSRHVKEADIAIALHSDNAKDSYLNIDKIISAAISTNSQAIIPGYGFLSENVLFAASCAKFGINFIGPTIKQISDFGLKHSARKLASEAKILVIPGTGILNSLEEAIYYAKKIGYPVMLKSTSGGGGIGIEYCENENILCLNWHKVKRTSKCFFNCEDIFIEKYINYAKHIEVQIFGDGNGKVIALGERDCSLQRRNQKLIEETPANNLSNNIRNSIISSAIRLGKLVNYQSVGTVEYIYDIKKNIYYFLEVNTRLQVEHPITECVMKIDLIKYMLKLASGENINWSKLGQKPQGIAIEARVYAENPQKNFQPSSGVITAINFPKNIRVDSWIENGTKISTFYDSMLAKFIAHGNTRSSAIQKMLNALNSTAIHGIYTNLSYLKQIIKSLKFKKNNIYHTKFLDTLTPQNRVIEVLAPGMFTTIQDYPGRIGYWHIGVPPSGPIDDFAFRIANRIVGNHEKAAGLECTWTGPFLKFYSDEIIAITGADCKATIDNITVQNWQPLEIKSGQILKLNKVQNGYRVYIAIRNGLDVPKYLGSHSTFSLGKFGGHAGRSLIIGDMLLIAKIKQKNSRLNHSTVKSLHPKLIPIYNNTWNIGVLYGPHGAPDFFTADSINNFLMHNWIVHHHTNRLGIRLIGPKPIWSRKNGGEAGLHPSNIHDCEYAIGAINFTGDFPVILAHDGPSLGGFVCPFTIAKAELWKIGQVKPGDSINFYLLSFNEAILLEKNQNNIIETLDTPIFFEQITNNKFKKVDDNINAILTTRKAVMNIPNINIRQSGDKNILIEYGENKLDLKLRIRIHFLMKMINKISIPGIEELSPGVNSLQIKYDSRIIKQKKLIKLILDLENKLTSIKNTKIKSRIIRLPMSFEDITSINAVKHYQETICSKAPWLPNNVNFLQRINGLNDIEELYNIIFNAKYLVLGLGDVYLGAPCAIPIDPRHRLLSSKYNPSRNFTPEGTVGIGGMYMCIYGTDSPGGYQLIGRTIPIWNTFIRNSQFIKNKPWLFRFFDQITFYPVTEKELNILREDFYEGRIKLSIKHTIFNFNKYQLFLKKNAQSISQFRSKQNIAFKKEMYNWNVEEKNNDCSITEIETSKHKIDQKNCLHVISDIHGSIWKILVKPNDLLKQGTDIMIVETMKISVKISSSQEGRIKQILCKVGQFINPGDSLIVLEKNIL